MAFIHLPFQSMCVALERARAVSGDGDGPWTVGLRDARGELLASAMLDSYGQVKAFTQAMEELGFLPSVRDRKAAAAGTSRFVRVNPCPDRRANP